jgi:hypothetical protein
MKLATMIRAAERWCRVSVSDLEGHQLRLLRAELGLDPHPPPRNARPTAARASPHDQQATDLQARGPVVHDRWCAAS